jgi:thioredoxin 1
MTVYDIASQDQLQQLFKQYRVVVVDVWGAHCGPCHALAPKYEQLSQKYASASIVFTKNNVEQMIFSDVTGLPTIMFFVNGQLFNKVLGANIKEIEESVVKALQASGSAPQAPGNNTQTAQAAQQRPERGVLETVRKPSENIVNKKSQSSYKTYGDMTK